MTRGWWWDVSRANRAIRFFEEVLCLNGGEFEGKPFVLQPWETFIVGCLFGWVDSAGLRRFQVAYMEIGKGNGKSPLAAGIGHYCLTSDGESRAEVYAAASKRDQAMVLFRDAVAMVELSPELAKHVRKFGGEHAWNLTYAATHSFFRVIASDDNQSGPRPSCALMDEIHEHRDGTIVNMLRQGAKGRRQPLFIEITNSGVDRTSICHEHHEYSIRVMQGRVPAAECDRWFAYVCALDPEDEEHDAFLTNEVCWIKANPNLGVSIQLDYLRGLINEAKGMPAKLSLLKRLNFCMWVESYSPWIDASSWLRCERADVDIAEWEGKRCCAGLDLSQKKDLTAAAYAFQLGGDRVGAFLDFWTPRETLVERSRNDHVEYVAWVEQGFVHSVEGKFIDYAPVVDLMLERQAQFNIEQVAFDPYMMPYFIKAIEGQAASGALNLVEHPQGAYKKKDSVLWMPHSIELLEKLVLEGRLVVLKNPCLTWNVSSAVLEQKNEQGARLFNKRRSFGRIDGLVALAMAVGALLTGGDEKVKGSVYNEIAKRKAAAAAARNPFFTGSLN